jgi:hypothetical protein
MPVATRAITERVLPAIGLPSCPGGNAVNELGLPARVLDGDFAGWLQDAMHARRISTRVLAMRVGVHHTTISRLLHDNRDPQLSTVIALVRVLGTDAPDGRR